MALATVTNAKIISTFFEGRGARVAEEYQSRGETRKSYTVLWFQSPHGLNVGDVITASGAASVKMGKPWTTDSGEQREGKPELHINVTKVESESAPAGGQYEDAPF